MNANTNTRVARLPLPCQSAAVSDWLDRQPSSLYAEGLEGQGLDVRGMRRRVILDGDEGELWSLHGGSALHGLVRLRRLEWDTRQLGVEVHSVVALASDGVEFAGTLLEGALAGKRGLIMMRLRADHYGTIHALEAAGFRLVDTMNIVIKELDRKRVSAGASDGPVTVVARDPSAPHQAAFLADLAGKAFQHGRMYHDPRIPAGRADAFYDAMAGSLLRQGNGVALVARVGDDTAGFIVGEVDDHIRFGGGALGYLGLIAVAERFRGQGVARALLREFEMHMAERVCWLEVGTQTHNPGALNLYAAAGYEFVTSLVTMHAWRD